MYQHSFKSKELKTLWEKPSVFTLCSMIPGICLESRNTTYISVKNTVFIIPHVEPITPKAFVSYTCT